MTDGPAHEWRRVETQAQGKPTRMECVFCIDSYRPDYDDEPPGPCLGERGVS